MSLDNPTPKPDTESMTCEACGSDRVITGPFYSQQDIVCMECGHRKEVAEVNFVPTEQERAQEEMAAAQEVLQQELTMEIMQDPKKMEEYLANLKKAQATLAGSGEEQAEKVRSPRKRKHNPPAEQGTVAESAELEIDEKLIWQAIHVYKRPNSSWQQTLSEAREEMKYRNNNILCFAHDHSFGEACVDSCRQIQN